MATTLNGIRAGAWPACPYTPCSRDTGAALSDRALGVLDFGGDFDSEEGPQAVRDPRRARVPQVALSGSGNNSSILWLSEQPVRHGWRDAVGWATNGSVAFVQLRVPEAELERDFEAAIGSAYRRLQAAAVACGCPEPLRMWNYLSAINEGQGDDERYRRFCVGRYPVLAALEGFPAATVIGSRAGSGLILFALYGRQAGFPIENPQQVSAFRYPARYGRRSPSFSRATLLPWADGARLMVSGTASIVGHASVHPGDPVAQFACSMGNIAAVRDAALQHAAMAGKNPGFELESAIVYVRNPAHLAALQPLSLIHI